MTQQVDLTKIKMGDVVLVRHKVIRLDPADILRSVEASFHGIHQWLRQHEIAGHEPALAGVGDSVFDSNHHGCRGKIIRIIDEGGYPFAILKDALGHLSIRPLSSLTITERAKS